MRYFLLTKVLFFNFVFSSIAQSTYDARISEKEILTPKPNNTPTINGPKIYGARPNKQFIYRIPCQGERPMNFSVENLPEGLKLDAEKGIISGFTPSSFGTYKMIFSAKNSHGKTNREFKLVVGDKLVLTPPMGWNSWGGHMFHITDEVMRMTADIMEERGLADVGFQYISIDDCWMRVSQEKYDSYSKGRLRKSEGFNFDGYIGDERDENGNILPNAHFPDMKAMTDYIHSKGLKAGIYSSPGKYTCQLLAGSYNHQAQDAKQYAKWGFDLLKYDLCRGVEELKATREIMPKYRQSEYWKPMADYLVEQDRDIVFNLCQYGREEPWSWAPQLGVQTWRTGGDLNHHVDHYLDQALRLATELRDYSKPGQWNDPDFMYLHYLRDHTKNINPSKEIPLSTNQRYQYVTLWSITTVPFFFSCDMHKIDDFTIGLLSNAHVANINQDELAHVGEVIHRTDDEVLIVKKLADGSRAVAVFNTNKEKEADIELKWEAFGKCCTQSVYDVWRNKNLGTYKGGMSVTLSPNGVAYFIIKDN